MTEAELLSRIKENPAAFSEFFTLYYHPIFSYILRRTGNFDDAADIAAETFLKAFTHIRNFSYQGISVKVWLYRIATNEVNLFFRSQRKRHSLLEKVNGENRELFRDYLREDKEALEAELHRHEQFLTVVSQLKTLPVKYQEVLALRYFEGKDNREIAEILNLKEGTLKSLLSRGLEKLRKKCNEI